ncbi:MULTISPECIES: FAS1-like dehydratase domain-containing protein [Bhargavaea]|uniref:MaoC family dehydratase N-terminal domain-containing protein n=1 Tax=Bhargavaea changchunensis TaxID=2134037 RepID=A0ABW2NAX1_9BACL|nr:MaoC family dehydratase N-terminal domain-containing protein [Bhargavaea sp. CC-171006]
MTAVGYQFDYTPLVLEPELVRTFSESVGYSGPGLPPTIYSAALYKGERNLYTFLEELGFGEAHVLHVEQHFETIREPEEGETLRMTSRVTGDEQKKKWRVLIVETSIRSESDEVARAKATYFCREGSRTE